MAKFWKIEETVGPYYFTWSSIYETAEGARKALAQARGANPLNCRIVLYETGKGNNGPARAED